MTKGTLHVQRSRLKILKSIVCVLTCESMQEKACGLKELASKTRTISFWLLYHSVALNGLSFSTALALEVLSFIFFLDFQKYSRVYTITQQPLEIVRHFNMSEYAVCCTLIHFPLCWIYTLICMPYLAQMQTNILHKRFMFRLSC
ncbi:hypothetical protein BD560DRAFT_424915 [Blakeslea trispora]|nr:hypothetical protein BD560DRAFT_424915 [Blakeslea trispora]